MVTYSQYIKRHRRTKQFRSSTPHFEGSPFKYAHCVRVGTVKPKKPNSAQRKIAKVCLTNGRYLIAYIPGFGHKLQKNSEVMVRGGRVPDLPGVRYHLIRQKKDFNSAEFVLRANRRSKYSTKSPFFRTQLSRRSQNKIHKQQNMKKIFKLSKEKKTKLLARLASYYFNTI